MIIVSGAITLRPGRRDEFLQASRAAMAAARRAPGCEAFVVAADPIEADVANVYEAWESEDALLAFRRGGPPADMRAMIAEAKVLRHEVAKSAPA